MMDGTEEIGFLRSYSICAKQQTDTKPKQADNIFLTLPFIVISAYSMPTEYADEAAVLNTEYIVSASQYKALAKETEYIGLLDLHTGDDHPSQGCFLKLLASHATLYYSIQSISMVRAVLELGRT